MKKHYFGLLALAFLMAEPCVAQQLKPGFDLAECTDMLKMASQFGDGSVIESLPPPSGYKSVYRSPMVGLDNLWDLWISTDSRVAVISVRGTTANSTSWLANFYAAMVPASGELQISETEKFNYRLADNPKAAVHVGWLVSTAFLSKDILPKLDSCYKNGIKDFIIAGHSQGGAIAYLLTAHLYSLQRQKVIPADIRFKTYNSAAPKPGNLYFAYEYEAMTQGGWAYNTVNSADWVPEVPLSVQTVNDFNTTNPFSNAKAMIGKQKLLQRLALRHVYNNLSKPSLKAQRNYQKYLGNLASKSVRKNISGYAAPEYYNSNNYVRTGAFVVLLADSAYYKTYPDSKEKIFIHHFPAPYLLLAGKLGPAGQSAAPPASAQATALGGTWELDYISGSRIAFGGLYPDRKPVVTFDVENSRISGNTSCNAFNGKLVADGNKISFANPLATTRMMCPGEGERAFLDTLKKVNAYAINGNTLTFIMGDTALMRFVRK